MLPWKMYASYLKEAMLNTFLHDNFYIFLSIWLFNFDKWSPFLVHMVCYQDDESVLPRKEWVNGRVNELFWDY